MAPGLSNGHVTGDVCKFKVVAQIYFDASNYRLRVRWTVSCYTICCRVFTKFYDCQNH